MQIQTNIVRVDGQRSVYLPVLKQGGDTNTIAVVDGVREAITTLFDVPKQLTTRVVFDQSQFVKTAIETLLHEGGIGLLLTSRHDSDFSRAACARRWPCFFPFRSPRWQPLSLFLSAAVPSTAWCWADSRWRSRA